MSGEAPALLRVAPAGDSALLAEFPQRIDPAVNAAAATLAARLRSRCGSTLRDVVVGYATVTVYFDPLVLDASWLEDQIRTIAAEAALVPDVPPRVIDVPVCYDDECGPDLPLVAQFGGLSTDDVVQLHAGHTYRVYALGFVPGFAYLGEVDARIAAPRRPVPRAAVPAGSVGIAGRQTGVYPKATPGGWNIVGRTPLRLVDPEHPESPLFTIGDHVRFRPVTRDVLDGGTRWPR